ncbi:hypothetical protein GGX14DRAFT_408582 [Mycena pura]|uniref:Uncharacterized protein n=1 Tax=Mycena pura TaxID=153505 RepID=A0AAD6XVT2_9AGAR|nr:hypothetical protein GGX14DRAFT_408582 [Mycena pura]
MFFAPMVPGFTGCVPSLNMCAMTIIQLGIDEKHPRLSDQRPMQIVAAIGGPCARHRRPLRKASAIGVHAISSRFGCPALYNQSFRLIGRTVFVSLQLARQRYCLHKDDVRMKRTAKPGSFGLPQSDSVAYTARLDSVTVSSLPAVLPTLTREARGSDAGIHQRRFGGWYDAWPSCRVGVVCGGATGTVWYNDSGIGKEERKNAQPPCISGAHEGRLLLIRKCRLSPSPTNAALAIQKAAEYATALKSSRSRASSCVSFSSGHQGRLSCALPSPLLAGLSSLSTSTSRVYMSVWHNPQGGLTNIHN